MSVADFVESCDAAFRLYGAGEMLNPAREESLSQENGEDVFRLRLPGLWPGRYRGEKLIEEHSDVKTGRLGSRVAKIQLEDLKTDYHVVLDAEYITNMRTGAAGVLGAKYLAGATKHVAILGTGRIAHALALCADVCLKPEVICATSRKAENREAFARELHSQITCPLNMVDSVARCVQHADVILASVPTPEPIVFETMVDARAHISVLGGDQRTQQLDMDLFLSRPLVPDHADQVLKSGEFIRAQKENSVVQWVKTAQGDIQNIGQAALGGLENLRGQGVIAYFSGMAIQDVHAASQVWERHPQFELRSV